MNTLDNEVKDAIQRLSDADLTRLVEADFREHTEEAVAFAREELTRRGLPKKKEQPAEAAEPETKVPVPDAPPASPPTDSAEVAAETSPFASSQRPRRWNRALSRLLRWGRHRPSD